MQMKTLKKILSTRVGSYDYEYSSRDMIYHDTYFGGTNFMGEEVVYLSGHNTPIWGMNYYGVVLDQSVTEEVMDTVLRPALMRVGENNILPIRGPQEFIHNGYRYNFKVKGSLDNFEGEETIDINNDKIYVLKCHGGSIKR